MSDIFDNEKKIRWLHHVPSQTPTPAEGQVEHVYQDMIDDLYMRVDELRVMADNMVEFFKVGDVTISELQDIRKLNWTVNSLADSLNTAAEDMDSKYGHNSIKHYAKFHKVTLK